MAVLGDFIRIVAKFPLPVAHFKINVFDINHQLHIRFASSGLFASLSFFLVHS